MTECMRSQVWDHSLRLPLLPAAPNAPQMSRGSLAGRHLGAGFKAYHLDDGDFEAREAFPDRPPPSLFSFSHEPLLLLGEERSQPFSLSPLSSSTFFPHN